MYCTASPGEIGGTRATVETREGVLGNGLCTPS